VDAGLKKRDEELNKDLNNNIIYYDENSSYFNAENRIVMTNIVPILKSKPELKIFIQSYCDKQGSNDYNLWLSEKRMNRVIDYLVANGIERSRISGNFKGEAEPLVNCKSCNDKQLRLNRRTTIKFVP
jgi:outer membrane protein OmpA-like peptidoglycan-associated protein